MKKLTYHPHDLKKIGAHLAIKMSDGVRLMEYDLAFDVYAEDQPIRIVDVLDTQWIEPLQSMVYIFNNDVINEDTQEILGQLCLVLPYNLVESCVKPIDQLI